VLPEAFASDPDRLARFEREAKVLASLNHSGIAHLYGFESATMPDGSGGYFLAMELVEGEDLKERLKRGPIPLDEALPIAKQVAEALEEAHEKGIVHRDLKPANVKVTPDGKVKVLDFGLAKAWTGEASGLTSSSDLSESPTLAHTGTAAGLILGTAAYMSPEQARGKPVDKRADVWAFGALLYEMLTGERLFGGETVSDVLAAVLTREPDWAALPAATPAAVRPSVAGRRQRRDGEDLRRAALELGQDRTGGPGGPRDALPGQPAPVAATAHLFLDALGLAGLGQQHGHLRHVRVALDERRLRPEAGDGGGRERQGQQVVAVVAAQARPAQVVRDVGRLHAGDRAAASGAGTRCRAARPTRARKTRREGRRDSRTERSRARGAAARRRP
jgi:hypothetical protein